MSTPTPRTDAKAERILQEFGSFNGVRFQLVCDFARQLERELEEAKALGHSVFTDAVKREGTWSELVSELKEDVRRADVMLTAHQTALVKAREVIGDVASMNAQGGLIGRKTVASAKEALTAINEVLEEKK